MTFFDFLIALFIAFIMILIIIIDRNKKAKHISYNHTPPMESHISDASVIDAIQKGKRHEAITLYAKLHQVDLERATEVVESLSHGAQPYHPNDNTIKQMILNGKKIKAVKTYREIHHTGLKEAKEAIDAMARNL